MKYIVCDMDTHKILHNVLLSYNEYIVYNEEQVTIGFVCELKN